MPLKFWRPRQWSDKLCRNAESLAQHRWAVGIVLLIELFGCTLVPLPVALIMVGMVTAAPQKWGRFAIAATCGSVIGGLALYVIGLAFFGSVGAPLISFYGSEERWASVVEWFSGQWGISFVFLAGATTGLFRVASLGAGFTAMDPFLFLTILFLSRCARWFAECYAIKYVGGQIKTWPKQHVKYATVGAVVILFAALLVVTLAY
jgi:membrane protein YqaA with SNARE-associated domain